MMHLRRETAALAAAAILPLALAACGDDADPAGTTDDEMTDDEMTDEDMTDEDMTDEDMTDEDMTDDEMTDDG